MAVKLRAMTQEDYADIQNEVKSPTTKHGLKVIEDSLDSADLFGRYSNNNEITKSCARDNIRAYIRLQIPTVNRVLSENGRLISKILGVSDKDIAGILAYTLVRLTYDKDTNVFTSASELTSSDEFTCGADLILELIDEFDLDEARLNTFYGILDTYLFKSGKPASQYGTVHKGVPSNDSVQLCGGYVYTYKPTVDGSLKKHKTIEEATDIFLDYFSTANTRLTYLLAMKDKSVLYNMINHKIVVIPSGLRPMIDKGHDKLTKLYNRIITKNQEILMTENTRTSLTYLHQAKALDLAVSALQYKNLIPYEAERQKGAASILEHLKSKQGQIRKNNLGKRQDYSGRAAVIVDPFLSINNIKVPKDMLVKIYKYHILKYMQGNKFSVGTTEEEINSMISLMEEHGIFNKVPVIMGRQPTLHRLSLLGFFPEPADDHAIGVPPLVCPGFNMDFDGDTAHAEVPLSDDAIYEVSKLMLPSQNLYLPKTGECTIVPRQDMLYGLYTCTLDYPKGSSKCTVPSYKDARDLVIDHKLKVSDTITVEGSTVIAGHAAFMACFPHPNRVEVKPVTSKNIKDYSEFLLETYNTEKFTKSTDLLVELGFKIARLYTMSMSLLSNDNAIPEYDNAIDVYNKNTEDIEYLYSIGMEDDETYNLECAEHLEVLQQSMERHIYEKLGTESGYRRMAESGARGNKSNLAQMFSFKGRIVASATETINVVIKGSYASGLSPLEGDIAAYGGRKGLIDKSLKTGDTGYASRRMWHATDSWVITNEDCGTTDGITITDKDVGHFIKDENERKDTIVNFITGRYEAGTNRFITHNDAVELVKHRKSITIRSPLKCKNPCCVKCYGIDPSTHEPVVIGTPIGILAAHSIGEPGTQLTMKQFQKGGVAGRGDVTSNFDRLLDYITVTDMQKKMKQGVAMNYEPIAWESGNTYVEHKGATKIIRIDGSQKRVVLPETANIKPYVEKGEGICDGETHGDFYIREIEEISGEDAAIKYLMLQLYNLYKDECKIVMTHFEVLVASMLHYMVLETDRSDLRVGQYVSYRKLHLGNTQGTRCVPKILGVNKIPQLSMDAIRTIAMECVGSGLARSCALGLVDELEDPIQRIMLGLPPKLGTHYNRYITERRLK